MPNPSNLTGIFETLVLVILTLIAVAVWLRALGVRQREHGERIGQIEEAHEGLLGLEGRVAEQIRAGFAVMKTEQDEREIRRVAILLEHSSQLGSVKGITELLIGQMAQQSARLGRFLDPYPVPTPRPATPEPPTRP